MEEGFTCECGSTSFWFFWDKVRCPICHNEYKHTEHYNGHLPPKEEYWMRRFNKEEHVYNENWEKAPETFRQR